jgi:hypothetical protein
MKWIAFSFLALICTSLFSQPEDGEVFIVLVGPLELAQVWNPGDCEAVPAEPVFEKDTSLFSNRDAKTLCYGVLYANLCLAVKWDNHAIMNQHLMAMSKIGPTLKFPEIAPFKQRVIANRKNRDSLVAIINEMGFELEYYLDENERKREHLLLAAASTIEVFYQYSVTCRSAKMHEAQGYFFIFRLLIDSLNSFNEQLATGEVKWLKNELESISAILPDEEFASKHTGLTLAQFDAIAGRISALRKTIVD